MHTTHNTLSENIRTQAAEILNRHLAAAIDDVAVWVNQGGAGEEVVR